MTIYKRLKISNLTSKTALQPPFPVKNKIKIKLKTKKSLNYRSPLGDCSPMPINTKQY